MRDYHFSLAADLACTAKGAFQQNRKVAHEPTSLTSWADLRVHGENTSEEI
jgi:hypothetical protein